MRLPVMFLLTGALLAGPAFAQMGSGGMGGGDLSTNMGGPDESHLKDDGASKKAPSNPLDDAESSAEHLRQQGHCDRAVPSLRGLAQHDGGEIAQYNLGLCLLDLAKTAPSPDAAEGSRKEGAVWILRSANAGVAKAQAEAVVLYLDGTGVSADPVEADKWALLYQHNVMRTMLHMPDLAQDVQAKLDASLDSAGRTKAENRADSWGQTFWPPRDYDQ